MPKIIKRKNNSTVGTKTRGGRIHLAKKFVKNLAQLRYILESNMNGSWVVIKRFETEDELIERIGSHQHLRGRLAMPGLQWKFFYPKGGEVCQSKAV